MDEDLVALLVVFGVWVALALAYAFVPMLDMPAAARVWGAGATVFLGLSIWLVLSGARGRRRKDLAP